MKLVSILIVEDYPLMRRGLRSVIESQSGWTVVAEAANGREGIRKARELQPEVVVLGFSMLEMSGAAAIRAILRTAPRTRVLVMTIYDDENLIEEAVRAGASGYINKADPEDELIRAVATLLDGRPYLGSPPSRLPMHQIRWPQRSARPESQIAHILSAREREILRLLSEGNSNKEIASRLQISARTVENHRARIMQKLEVHSLGDLIRVAIRAHLVRP